MACGGELPGAAESKPVAIIRLNSIHLSGSSCSAGGNRSQIYYVPQKVTPAVLAVFNHT